MNIKNILIEYMSDSVQNTEFCRYCEFGRFADYKRTDMEECENIDNPMLCPGIDLEIQQLQSYKRIKNALIKTTRAKI